MRCGPTGLTVMMANFTRLYFLVAAVVLCWLASRCLQGISAIDDFTCITKPRIDFDNEDTYIVAYLHGGNATLSFARTTFTRTGGDDSGQLQLPQHNQSERAPSLEGDEISILQLPRKGGKTRIGFFACKKGDDVSIGTAIMSRNAHFLPTFLSHTVNYGDSVTLKVNATNTSFTATRWRKNEENPPGLRNTPKKVIESADESDSGTYEIHLTEKRSAGRQALIRLFVRECKENRWGTPSCDEVCQVCFNGGVCEVASGVCICPPGFSGDFCEILLGPDRFGQDGSFRCSSSELLGSTCEGKLFCLPDPYGCSCASGYRGIDCNQGCPDGSFGASCLQTCHCMDDAPCNKTTGRCPGNCASGFKGINCQDSCREGHGGLANDCSTPCTVPAEVTELQDVTPLSLSANQIHLSWKFVSNRCAVTRYQVQYELTNLEQCQPMAPNRIDVGGDSYYGDSLTISSGVRPYSSYTVYVRAWNEVGPGSEMPLYVRTGESVPSVAPVYNGSSISSDSITFYWEPIPCGSRGGDITGYDYKVQDSTGTRIGDRQSVQTEMVVVSGLTPCMRYTFRVRAQTNGGPGPWTNPIQVPGLLDQFLVDRTTEPTEIRVTWQEPSNVGNCPVQYTVEYSLIKRGLCERIDSPSRQVWSGDTRPPVTIRELHPRSLYHVYVRASTTTGPGMVAEGEAVTSERTSSVAPVITGHNSSSDSITFYWEPIPCENRSGNITGYDYEVRDSRGAMIRDRQSVQTEMVVISELTPCMRYTFRVWAVNSVGLLGTWTEGMEVETSARVPEMVNQLSVTGIPDDPTEIRITWQKPTNTGDCTVQYTVEYALINRDQCEETQSPSRTSWQAGTQSPVTITGLFPHSTYRVYVTASTVAGVGMEAEAEGVTQVTATIVAPVINGSSISSDSITFYWEPIPCGSRGSDLTGYDYEVRDSRGATIRDSQSVQTEMAVVSGLTPCMRYTFRVRAVNSVGLLGTWTEGMEVETSARGGVAQDAGRIDDFTCITKPRIDFDNEDTYIAAYLHGGSAALSFARTTFTRTGTSGEQKPSPLKLPPNHDILMLQSSEEGFSILQLPAVTNRKKRIGFFACRKNGGNVMSIGTAIMSRNADFLPTFPSWTVNRGNNVTLMVNASNSSRTQTRWRRNAKDPIKDWSDQLYMKMTSVSQSESTTYEVHFTGKRASGKQALMRLIVRGCEQDKWNAPCCDKTCPVCFNGGVCETRIGVCVCPPGFSGNFCEILLGPDRFGQDGSFQCSSDKLPGKTCEGKLFCLPDPYGCSCASGYKGIDCDEGCPDGSFGASCLQTCHCMDDAPCNKTTGRCPGNCASGFKGINCQDLCPEGYGGLAGNCSTRCTAPAEVTEFQDDTPLNLSANQIHLSWKFVSNRCAVMRYQVQYELTNLEQCQPMEPNRIDVEGDSYYGDSLIISSDVLPYSSYTVYVSAWNEMEKGPETSIDLCTGESVPSLAPVLTGSNISSESITFNWEPIPCGSRGGDITGYIYEVQDSTGTMVVDSQSVSAEMAVVVGLTPCTIYAFKVQAETSKGPGPWTEDMEVETSAVVPEMVNQLTVSGTPVPTEIQVTWQKPTNTGNCTVQYTVEYALINRDLCEGFPAPLRIRWPTGTLSAMTITGVYPNSIYRVFVTASTIAGLGTKLWDEAVTQGTAPSGPPSNVSLSNFTLNTLSFAWDLPLCGQRNGNITHYRYNLTGIASRQTEQANISQASIEFMGLVPFTPYVLTVFAINIFGSGPAATIAVQTGAPSEPGSLSVSTVSETSVTLEWRPPLFPNGKVFKYKIDQRVVARPYNDSFTFDADSKYESQEIPDESMTSSTVYNLEPSTEYEFLVYIVTSTNVVGKKAKVESFTAPATGMTPPEKPTLSGNGQSSTSSITIQLASTTPSKYVTSYQVGVKNTKAGVDTNRRSAGSGLEFGHFTESPTSYVAAELPRRLPDVFVVGDDREYDGYFNPSLLEGASYEIYFGAVSRISDKEFSVVWNEDPLVVQVAGGLSSSRQGIGLTVGVAVAMSMLAAVALVLALVVIWKRHQRSVGKEDGPFRAPSELSLHSIHGKDQNISPLSPDSDTPPARPQEKLGPTANKKPAHSHLEDPVALSNLANHIKSKKSRNGFQQDYETLPVTPLHPWTVAKKSHNMKKNRYTNIVAYDHSRVVLQCPDDSPHSDYINASYINGYKQEAQYIACQGPTKASVVDMWRMLWQEQVGIIVMLTNLVENGKVKCEKYWPDSLQKYADFTVTNISEEVLTNYVVRTFHLSKYSDPEGVFRELNHFHYTTWPDMKPPESSSLLQFVRRVQAAETTQPGPMVVHCSAGVGRTGTFITLDSMLTQAQAEGQVGVFNFVHAMREQRIMMVQTVDQYKFIFDALLESCLTENTAIPVARLQQDYAKLKKRDRKTGTTGIEEQFKMLETFTATYTEDKCRGGLESANVAKNRFPNFIPADKIRPYLMTPGEEGSTNYINAVFLDGYNKKSAYLATQSPLPNTLGDIWRMVFDYNSSCIVMLNSVDSDWNVPQYWPDEGSLQFGRLTVTFRNIDHQSDTVIVRQFGIRSSEKKSDKEQSICHIQYLAWPSGKEVPNSPSSLLKVLETVKMWTDDHPDEPVTVHCIDGLGCSGTLCALMTVLESVSQEQVVDVFQAVKKLRVARAGLVQTLAQYQLLYQLTQTSLDSNSIYENLR